MSISIRAIGASDQAFLWEMLYCAIYLPPGAEPVSREVLEDPRLRIYAEGWGRFGDAGYIALDGKLRTGAVWLRRLCGEPAGYGYIDSETPELSIAVLPVYRGRGIGSMLLERLISEASGALPAISLSVSLENPALELYRRFGFQVFARQEDSVAMVLRLKQK